ncbi:MAG: sigma 54-interacting transcriptional regulator [bacterium]|nr:sigma 54-interacting transcriptional regulator [bacterium]
MSDEHQLMPACAGAVVLEDVLESIDDGIITIDRRSRVVSANRAALQFCRCVAGKAIGRPCREVLCACCAAAVERTLATQQRSEAVRTSGPCECGHSRVVRMRVTPLWHGKEFAGAVVVLRDDTQLVRLEESLGERQEFYSIIARSRGMQEIFDKINALADLPTTVLITGESGTGKELVADALHAAGARRDGPLVKVNCAALPETLVESELFGHVKGAFTGAIADKKGRFALADGGTLFLDEIGAMPLAAQARLLRVVQDKVVERVGDTAPIKVDVRIVAATNAVLEEKVRRGEFREDLYFRLKVFEIHLPPLRERREDIPLLAAHFLQHYSRQYGKPMACLSPEVNQLFLTHAWPGNVRQLQHVIEHAVIVCKGGTITAGDLPADFVMSSGGGQMTTGADVGAADERARILAVLQQVDGNKAKAARLLGIDRTTLYRKLAAMRAGH